MQGINAEEGCLMHPWVVDRNVHSPDSREAKVPPRRAWHERPGRCPVVHEPGNAALAGRLAPFRTAIRILSSERLSDPRPKIPFEGIKITECTPTDLFVTGYREKLEGCAGMASQCHGDKERRSPWNINPREFFCRAHAPSFVY